MAADINTRLADIEETQRVILEQLTELGKLVVARRRSDNDETMARFRSSESPNPGFKAKGLPIGARIIGSEA